MAQARSARRCEPCMVAAPRLPEGCWVALGRPEKKEGCVHFFPVQLAVLVIKENLFDRSDLVLPASLCTYEGLAVSNLQAGVVPVRRLGG